MVVELTDADSSEVVRSAAVLLPVGQAPLTISTIQNAASFAAGKASPGAILTVFGTGFQTTNNLSAFPATEHEGLHFTIDLDQSRGLLQPMWLFAVIASACQVNLLVPNDLSRQNGMLEVRLEKGELLSNVFTLEFAPSAPGLFSLNDPNNENRRFAVAQLANTAWLAIPDGLSTALGISINCEVDGISPLSTCGSPARAGDVLQLYTTGLGLATDDGTEGGETLPNDEVAPASGNPLYTTVFVPKVLFGSDAGLEGEVLFSGLAPGFSGLYQVNVRVPQGVAAGDAVLVTLRMPDGTEDQALIAVSN